MPRPLTWLLLPVWLMACWGPPPARAADAAKPNVLFIAIDDLRDWVGCLGNPQVKTPNLDKLSARGMTFARGYCALPVCNPSRAALMSGMRSSTTGVYSNGIDWRPLITEKTPTLNQHFRAQRLLRLRRRQDLSRRLPTPRRLGRLSHPRDGAAA